MHLPPPHTHTYIASDCELIEWRKDTAVHMGLGLPLEFIEQALMLLLSWVLPGKVLPFKVLALSLMEQTEN